MKKGLLKTIVSVLIVVTVLASVAVLAGCSKQIAVPDLTGMTKEDAETKLTDLGLTMNVQRERFSKKNPAGTIDGMITEVGTNVEEGSEVKVIVSLGEGREVPSLSVLTGKEAENLVRKVGLNPIIVEEFSDEIEAGNVIEYTDAGQTIPKGADVTITVSKGPKD